MTARWLRDWDVILTVMLTGLLTGLLVFMAFNPSPAGCRHAVARVPGRAHLTWVCDHP